MRLRALLAGCRSDHEDWLIASVWYNQARHTHENHHELFITHCLNWMFAEAVLMGQSSSAMAGPLLSVQMRRGEVPLAV